MMDNRGLVREPGYWQLILSQQENLSRRLLLTLTTLLGLDPKESPVCFNFSLVKERLALPKEQLTGWSWCGAELNIWSELLFVFLTLCSRCGPKVCLQSLQSNWTSSLSRTCRSAHPPSSLPPIRLQALLTMWWILLNTGPCLARLGSGAPPPCPTSHCPR